MNKKYCIEMTIEDCFVKYYTEKIACVCDADKREIIFVEE